MLQREVRRGKGGTKSIHSSWRR